jgi:hypothetical protein
MLCQLSYRGDGSEILTLVCEPLRGVATINMYETTKRKKKKKKSVQNGEKIAKMKMESDNMRAAA